MWYSAKGLELTKSCFNVEYGRHFLKSFLTDIFIYPSLQYLN